MKTPHKLTIVETKREEDEAEGADERSTKATTLRSRSNTGEKMIFICPLLWYLIKKESLLYTFGT
jgi:hypothetical protein